MEYGFHPIKDSYEVVIQIAYFVIFMRLRFQTKKLKHLYIKLDDISQI